MDGWYVTDVCHRALARPFDDPGAPEALEDVARVYAELGSGCCDYEFEWLDDDGMPATPRAGGA